MALFCVPGGRVTRICRAPRHTGWTLQSLFPGLYKAPGFVDSVLAERRGDRQVPVGDRRTPRWLPPFRDLSLLSL